MKRNYPLHWPNFLFLTLSPVAALAGAIYCVRNGGFHRFDLALLVTLFFATGLSITAGYHRHFAHVSYKAHPAVRLFYLIFGACAMQNSALNWASDHRLHHRYTDTDRDPYNAAKGFWASHIGWIFYQSRAPKQLTNVGDLMRDPVVRWQHRYHVAIALIIGWGLPILLGAMVGRPLEGFVWGGLVRVVFVHHMTFFINSLAHMYGNQPYSRADTSRDSWWLALLTNGEGYHNFHHRFPSDYRNGIQWYQWDPTKWMIAGLHWFKMTHKLHRVPPQLILKARMEVEALEAQRRLQTMPSHLQTTWSMHLEAARVRFEHAAVQWADTKVKYREWKRAAIADSEHVRQAWKERLQHYEARLQEARAEWRGTLRQLHAVPLTSL